MRALPLEAVHAAAVKLGRSRGLSVTAGRLAACNVDPQISSIVGRLRPPAWLLSDQEIIEACGQELWVMFLQAELNIIE